MSLRPKQSRFAWMLAMLILKAFNLGFEVTMGDVWARDGHKKNSKHYDRLAADINLFKDGEWLIDGSGHDVLHDYWDGLGGGKRIENDLNHYEL